MAEADVLPLDGCFETLQLTIRCACFQQDVNMTTPRLCDTRAQRFDAESRAVAAVPPRAITRGRGHHGFESHRASAADCEV